MSSDLVFKNTTLTFIEHEGQSWVTARDLANALGYGKGVDPMTTPSEDAGQSLLRLFSRHADGFTSDETTMLVLQTAGGPQQTRVFSLRGCRLIAMLSTTERAKEFRRWVLDVLDNLDHLRSTSPGLYTIIVNPRTFDEALGQYDLVETIAQALARASAPPTVRTPFAINNHVRTTWRSHVPAVNTLLKALGIPIVTLEKLHHASRLHELPVPTITPRTLQ